MKLPQRAVKWLPEIEKLSYKYNIDPYLFTALIWQESGFQEDVVSPAGAIGLCQLMPSTAEGLGVNPYDPKENLLGGAMYLHNSYEIAKTRDYVNDDNLTDIVLASYNAGWGACDKYQGVPNYPETQNYVRNVKAIYKDLKKEYPTLFGDKIKLFYHDGKFNMVFKDGTMKEVINFSAVIRIVG